MENAAQALYMAAGVLIGLMILSLGVYLFANFGQTSKELHEQIDFNQITEFNAQFTKFEGIDATIHDVISLANLAVQNNKNYPNDPNYTVNVFIDTENVSEDTPMAQQDRQQRIETEMDYQNGNQNGNHDPDTHIYHAYIVNAINGIQYNTNGRVSAITFTEVDRINS